MSVQLEVRDGTPWWLSPDIWTVPGDDPEGPPGIPIAGTTTYVWATVHNSGKTPVENATVKFYWANPAVGFDRDTAEDIGIAFVTLDAGEQRDVLCLTPWATVYVNEGHECVLVEAFHSADPLPPGLAFNVPTDRHVAQRNLSVVQAVERRFALRFEVHNSSRRASAFRLVAEQGKLDELRRSASPSHKAVLDRAGDGRIAAAGFIQKACPTEQDMGQLPPRVEGFKLAGGGRTGFTLAGMLEGAAGVVHVRQFDERREVGGLSILVLGQ